MQAGDHVSVHDMIFCTPSRPVVEDHWHGMIVSVDRSYEACLKFEVQLEARSSGDTIVVDEASPHLSLRTEIEPLFEPDVEVAYPISVPTTYKIPLEAHQYILRHCY